MISRFDIMIDRIFFLGFIRIHILYHASKEEICGIEMIEELKRHGYSVSPGLIYPILHSMEKEGYLSSKKMIVKGKARKYYKITGKGLRVLEKSKEKIKELVNEVLEE